MRIEGARVLVTGATGGIGRAVVDALVAAHAEIVVTGRRSDILATLDARPAVSAVTADLSERDGLDALLAGLGDIDLVVANAALPASGPLLDLEPADIDRALEVNLRVPVQLARALAPAMVARGRGHLVFVSSLAGLAATPSSSVYNATKFGLRGFALGLRQDLHGTGVGVSVVMPGFVRDAGMFADSGATLPRGVGTVTPAAVARAVLAAVRSDRAEVVVAPLPLRIGAYLGTLAPAASALVTRRLGGAEVAASVAEGQRTKR